MLKLKLTSSAMGKAHQIRFTLPLRENSHATGKSTQSCLAMDTNILYTPFPRAWNTLPTTMQYPAKQKLKQIIRRAGIPITRRSDDASASNSPMSQAGNSSITTRPASMIPTAYLMLLFISPEEAGIIAIGAGYLRIEGAFYCGIGILFLLYGYYRGINRPEMSLVLTVISLGTRVALAYMLAPVPQIGVVGIWSAIPIGWILADVTGILYLRRAEGVAAN